MEEDKIKELVDKVLNVFYGETTWTSQLNYLFCKDDESIEAYIKPNREFWHFDGNQYHKIKVTYVRTGIMFFIYVDKPEEEHAWPTTCFNCVSLYAAQIYPYEIGKILSKLYKNADVEFPEICKTCKWDDCNGRITVDVIWD